MIFTAALSANAGLSLTIDGTRFWMDVLHDRKTGTFSTVTPELFARLMEAPAFDRPDFLLYTHRHPDHYSRELTEKALEAFPDAFVVAPLAEYSGPVAFTGIGHDWDFGELHFHFFKAPHEGKEYASVRNYGFLLECGGKLIFAPGDSAIGDPQLAEVLAGRHIDLAILNFPWITLLRGRKLICESLKPEQLLVCHLPFAEDDMNGYRALSARSLEKLAAALPELKDARLIMDPLQSETFTL